MTNEIYESDNSLWWNCAKWGYTTIFGLVVMVSFFGKYCNIRKLYINILLRIFEFSVNKTSSNKYSLEEKDSSSHDVRPDDTSFSDVEGFELQEVCNYAKSGMEAVIEDSVMPRFVSEKLPYWNLLSRNNCKSYELVSMRLTCYWIVGFFIRYVVLLPIRVVILSIGLLLFCICTLITGFFPNGAWKRKLNAAYTVLCFRFVGGCISLVVNFHNSENKPKNGIVVANHTTPIDSLVLATDNCYDMVGQKHGGLIGYLMWVLSRSSSHIWFERGIAAQRHIVTTKLREHTADDMLPPILIFPEGVCVNNTSVMQFKKGVFEIDTEIYPVAIKFDPRFGDAYWCQDYFSSYIMCLITSWAIVCDVWYLPPVKKRPDETAIQLANRVKAMIAAKAGLYDSSWDGFLKTREVKSEWKEAKKEEFANYLLSKSTFLNESNA